MLDLDEPVIEPGHERKLHRENWSRLLGAWRPIDFVRVRLELGDAILADGYGALTLLDRGASQLDRSELAATSRELALGLGDPALALRQVSKEVSQLGLPGLQVRCAQPEHALDRSARISQKFLATLEVGDRLVKASCMLVELASPFGDEVFQPFLWSRARRKGSPDDAAQAIGRVRGCVSIGVAVTIRASHCTRGSRPSADGPILSRRVRSSPPARRDFAGVSSAPALECLRERVKLLRRITDMPIMDANGARLLAARIRAGVAIGARIELVKDASDDSGLCAGDRGVVDQIDERGYVFVSWDRGFASEIDPESTPIHQLAA